MYSRFREQDLKDIQFREGSVWRGCTVILYVYNLLAVPMLV